MLEKIEKFIEEASKELADVEQGKAQRANFLFNNDPAYMGLFAKGEELKKKLKTFTEIRDELNGEPRKEEDPEKTT